MNYNWLREDVLDQLMKQAILRKVLHVDADRNLQIKIPIEMGDEFEVIVLPIQPDFADRFSEFEQFNIGAYSASTEESDEEDAVWEKYVKA
jgi:hypothetical protein